MQRRTFLKNSAMGIGTLAGMYSGILKADGESPPHSRYGDVMTEGKGPLAWGTNAVVLKSPWSDVPSLDDLLVGP